MVVPASLTPLCPVPANPGLAVACETSDSTVTVVSDVDDSEDTVEFCDEMVALSVVVEVVADATELSAMLSAVVPLERLPTFVSPTTAVPTTESAINWRNE